MLEWEDAASAPARSIEYDGSVSERDLEDWAEQHMAALIHPNARLLGRQVTLPSGRRLDLLFEHAVGSVLHITVVELKAVRAGFQELCQCFGYVKELRTLRWNDTEVRGVLAAPDFDAGVEDIVGEMRAMATMWLTAHLAVRACPLYDTRDHTPCRPPDVDSTKPARIIGYAPAEQRERLRETVRTLWRSRPPVDDPFSFGPSRALVPLSLTPARVAYPNSNGKH